MADSGDPTSGETSPPVPQLIDVYKSQREALRVQSRDLARLRQEIRGTAEREAREIVEAARSNVRQILVNARRELLVLAAQVQAAIDDPEQRSDRLSIPSNEDEIVAATDATDLIATRDLLVGARQDMHEIIDDARPHLDALADEARVLRGALAQADVLAHTDVFPSEESLRDTELRPLPQPPRTESFPPTPVRAAQDIPAPILDSGWPDESTRPMAVPAALTLSGRPRKEAAPAAAPLRTFVLAFAVLGTVVVVGTIGWLRMAPKGESSTPAAAAAPVSAARSQPATASMPTAAPPVARRESSRELPVLSLQARRDVWIRTTIDGRGDVGRLLHAGDTQEITGAREIVIRAGDAGALWVSVNGSEPARVGRDGEVLTRRFALQPPLSASPLQPPASDSNQGTTAATDGQEARNEGTPAPPRASTGTTSPALAASEQARDSGAAARDAKLRTADASRGAGGATPSAADPFGIAKSADGRLVAAAERWLDAYYRGERAPDDVPQPVVKDERTSDQRLPPRLAEVHRTLDDVRLQLVGDSALITAKMTEQSLVGDRTVSHDSLISQMWTRSGASWRLVDVRIISEPKLRGE